MKKRENETTRSAMTEEKVNTKRKTQTGKTQIKKPSKATKPLKLLRHGKPSQQNETQKHSKLSKQDKPLKKEKQTRQTGTPQRQGQKSANKLLSAKDILYLAPLIAAIGIVPLIVYLKVIPLDDLSFEFWTGQSENYDFFSFYKSLLIMVSALFSIAASAIKGYREGLHLKRLPIYYAPLAAYALLIAISTLLSPYPGTAEFGFVDRYEGMYVLLSYIVLTAVTINLTDREEHYKTILAVLFTSAALIGTLGILQYFGADLFKTRFGKALILPKAHHGLIDSLNFTFGEYSIYSTLYNTNYVGSYTAMLMPLTLGAYVFADKKAHKIAAGIFSCLIFANWVGCHSESGYIGGIGAVILLMLLTRQKVRGELKNIFILFTCFVLIFIGMDYASGRSLSRKVGGTLANFGGPRIFGDRDEEEEKRVKFKDIIMEGSSVTVIAGEAPLQIALKGNEVMFLDSKDNVLQIAVGEAEEDESNSENWENENEDAYENNAAGEEDAVSQIVEGYFIFTDPAYDFYKFRFSTEQNIISLNIGKLRIDFYIQEDGIKIVGERGILLDDVDRPRTVGFEGREGFASGRGYIWSRSIPLLSDNILIGKGPDTYAIQFPQHDYVGKLKGLVKVNQIVDKPHNTYLQIGINTGVVSMLAYLFILGAYAINSLRLYFKKGQLDFCRMTGTAVFTAVAGYSVTALANDSLVSVAPVFWVLLGLGISCNYLIGSRRPASDGCTL